MAIAGRVAPIPKGEWDSTVEYSKLDIISRNKKSFMAKKASINHTPIDNDEYWMVIADSPGEMVGATDQEDGESGLVPQPLAGDEGKVLFGDGTFKEVKSSALLIDSGYVAIDYSILGG